MALPRVVRSLMGAMRPALSDHGFDILWPVPVAVYNERVLAAAPHAKLSPLGGSKDSVALIIGNTRALWKPFSCEYESGSISTRLHPLDEGYTEPKIAHVVKSLRVPGVDVRRDIHVRFAHDTRPDSLVAVAKLAHAAGLAHTCSATYLSLHPLLGPWVSYRAVVVVDVGNEPEVCDIDDDWRRLFGLWGWTPPQGSEWSRAWNMGGLDGLVESFDWCQDAPELYGDAARKQLAKALEEALRCPQTPACKSTRVLSPRSAAFCQVRRACADAIDTARVEPLARISDYAEFGPDQLLYHYDKLWPTRLD